MPAATLDGGSLRLPAVILTGVELVAQTIRVRLYTLPGEILSDATVGLPWREWLSDRRTSADVVAARLRALLEQVPGVTSIDSVTASRSGLGIVASARVTVQADGETADLEITSDPWLTAGAPAWYVVAGAVRSGPIGG